MHGHGMLSGIGRRVSSLFGILAPPVNDTVSRPLGRILRSVTQSVVDMRDKGETTTDDATL